MPTIFQRTENGLYPVGPRSMTPFPSGLVRIEQKYSCSTADAATHRATLAIGEIPPGIDTEPTIDGLMIYPTPHESAMESGLTEFTVTAFGRSSSELGNITKAQRLSVLSGGSSFPKLLFYLWELSGTIVIPSSDALQYDELGLDTDLLDPFGFYASSTEYSVLSASIINTIPGTPPLNQTTNIWQVDLSLDGVTASVSYVFQIKSPIINIVSQRNFGDFVEIDITTKPSSTLDSTV